MINTLLLLWSMLAIAAVFVGGLLLVIFPYGGRWAGIFMVVMATALGYTCVELAREEWGWRRRRAFLRTQYPERSNIRRPYSAPTNPPRRPQRPVSAEERSGKRQGLEPALKQERQDSVQPGAAHA
jgi:hypothetical protein